MELKLVQTQLEESDEKCANCQQLLEEERLKVAEAKQKQITESRECLRLKEELKKLTSSHVEEKNAMQNHIDSLTSPQQSNATCDEDEDKINLRRQISALQERLIASEDRNKKLESIKTDMESDMQITKARLVQSTGKLKDLVTSGINEQLAVVKCEEYSNKIKELETENEILHSSLHAHSKTNTNTNNLADLQIAEKLVTNLNNGITIQSYKQNDLHNYKPPLSDLRPPSLQSVRHAALKKTSSIQEKRSFVQEKKSMNRTSSLKTLRRTLSGSQGNIEGRPPVAEGRPQVTEGRPPSSKSSFTSSVSSVVSESPRQERSRSIVKKKNSTSSEDSSNTKSSNKQKLSK